jgi:hypothetical protein
MEIEGSIESAATSSGAILALLCQNGCGREEGLLRLPGRRWLTGNRGRQGVKLGQPNV